MIAKDQTFDEVPKQVPCPMEVKHIWEWFIDLDETRQVGMGVNPICFTEIQAWSQLNRIDLKPFEVEAIRAIDREYLKHQNSKGSKDV